MLVIFVVVDIDFKTFNVEAPPVPTLKANGNFPYDDISIARFERVTS